MSAETLRKAAALMRERAEAASKSPWIAFRARDSNPLGSDWVGVTRDLVVDYDPDVVSSQRLSVPDAAHIASWHPAVALAVALLLDNEANAMEPEWREEFDLPAYNSARADLLTAVARAYLGEDA